MTNEAPADPGEGFLQVSHLRTSVQVVSQRDQLWSMAFIAMETDLTGPLQEC